MIEKVKENLPIAEHLLEGKPGPHYLSGEVSITQNKLSLEATAIFPSSDPTIGERGHVNVAHYLFGMWNAAHILSEINGFKNTLSLEGKWKAHRIAQPDEPMKLHVEIVDPKVRKRTAKGEFKAIYTIGEKVYGEFNSSFIAQKVS